MKKVNLLVEMVMGTLLMFPVVVWSQCPNLNFSYGNLSNWQCYHGSCAGQNYQVSPSARIPGRIDIMSKAQLEQSGKLYDEYCNKLKKVPESYSFSCRVGNDSTGSQVDGIEYEMLVDSNNSLLILSYAWVMENPGHSLADQPQYKMTLKDSLGNVLNTPCQFIHFGGPAGSLLCDNGSLVARDWETSAYNLTSVIGQKIKIYFETWDCTLGEHFGYAYVVGECRPMRIDMAYCAGMPSVKLTAPEGFISYEWSRSSLPSWKISGDYKVAGIIIVPNPILGEIFTVKATNEFGCVSELQTVIQTTSIVPDFMFGVKDTNGGVDFTVNNNKSWYDTCNRTATFVDMTKVYDSKLDFIRWEIPGLNINSRDSIFTYTFPDPTVPKTYLVKMTAFAKNGCADTSKPTNHYITIYPSARIKINGVTQLCEGRTETLTATALRSTFAEFYWSWLKKDGATGNATGKTLSINGPGTYCLMSADTAGCYAYDTLVVKEIKPKLSNLSVKDVDCWGNATGSFSHGAIVGGSGALTEAFWTVWDNKKQVFVDSNFVTAIGGGLTFLNQKAGRYIFHGIDLDNCLITDTIFIKQPDSLRLIPTSQRTTCELNNGIIWFKATGGTQLSGAGVFSPYNFTLRLLSGKDTVVNQRRDSIGNLPAGVYTVKVVDKNSCTTIDTITVSAAAVQMIAVASVSLSENDIKMEINQDTLLYVAINPSDACNKKVVWKSDNTRVATVSVSGRVRAISNGTAYIIVTSDDGGLKDSCKITVSGVGVEQLRITDCGLRIYPNPTNYELRIMNYELKEGDVIEIYSVMGQKVLSYKSLHSQETTINIQYLPNGIYYIKVNERVSKFVKMSD